MKQKTHKPGKVILHKPIREKVPNLIESLEELILFCKLFYEKKDEVRNWFPRNIVNQYQRWTTEHDGSVFHGFDSLYRTTDRRIYDNKIVLMDKACSFTGLNERWTIMKTTLTATNSVFTLKVYGTCFRIGIFDPFSRHKLLSINVRDGNMLVKVTSHDHKTIKPLTLVKASEKQLIEDLIKPFNKIAALESVQSVRDAFLLQKRIRKEQLMTYTQAPLFENESLKAGSNENRAFYYK